MFFKGKLAQPYQVLSYKILFILALVFIARMIAMTGVPLNDSTEARYAEIARLMLVSDNWVSLMHYPNQYFWAKPPLSTWLTAISMKELGINPFAARFPALLLSLGCLALVSRMAYVFLEKPAALYVLGILATTFFFILDAGTVMTDPALLFCTCLVMVSFWFCMRQPTRLWQMALFVGWGLGLLAKGPVIGVFTVLPMMVWLTLNRHGDFVGRIFLGSKVVC